MSSLPSSAVNSCPTVNMTGDIFTLVQLDPSTGAHHFFEAVKFLERNPHWRPAGVTGILIGGLVPAGTPPPPPPPPMAPSVMDEYFEPLTNSKAQTLLNMGFTYAMLEFAGVKSSSRDYEVWGFPVYEDHLHHQNLLNVKLYDPDNREYKWRPFFEGRGKQLYMTSIARLALEHPEMLRGVVPNEGPWVACVVAVESEKDELFLLQWGIPAIASGGAKVWTAAFTRELYAIYELLSGLPVDPKYPHIKNAFVLGDLDIAGLEYNLRVKKAAPFVEIADWRNLRPDLTEGFDVAKLKAAGGTREVMLALLEASVSGEMVYDLL